ncbi:hypothetical protein [Comamonas sp. JC664]|uniref:hypothetical protein n=1 Tax=Comamonas sp. JC664 TaxID=2801917 RepID=UPI00174C089F|nr:hypothetical protein [Comamonas sp. JC664]MBL0697517.1 hypothetical protein [Comamonas sp. JC664]GHG68166.1 hypothetical protein GCM10012319_11050 [Comamonas sp. KCTC 72670]
MAGVATSLTIRLPALFFSVAVVGALIGFSWEHAVHRGGSSENEWSPPGLGADGSPSSGEDWIHTPEDVAVLKRALEHFPPYPKGSRPEALAADYLGAGAPMAVAWFSTEDSPAQVLEHYAQVLLDKGLPVLRQEYEGQGGYVGYWSPATEEIRLVSTLAQGGETLVFVSAGQVGPLLERAATVPEWLPVPANLQETRTVNFNLEGTSHHVVTGQLQEGSPSTAAERYLAQFREKGWTVGTPEPMAATGVAFEFVRESVSGRAVLREHSRGPGVELHLTLLRRSVGP